MGMVKEGLGPQSAYYLWADIYVLRSVPNLDWKAGEHQPRRAATAAGRSRGTDG